MGPSSYKAFDSLAGTYMAKDERAFEQIQEFIGQKKQQ
jgi:hypothetical protein